ncbi:hypothetical protein OOJ09_31825 [Mesorhizobium qingshengii]|uniref:Uncharacterized protein n=1 Tax=Mesorhizobium qingshengii TaxID=1165689 RepID=A0ABT4R5C4_9HYPH|nr:hypothetical protein [Mesorhizobium qingshengii]MCZ8548758.1 hypothetical protein [Mesorhizobium qingshengii]
MKLEFLSGITADDEPLAPCTSVDKQADFEMSSYFARDLNPWGTLHLSGRASRAAIVQWWKTAADAS